MTTQDSHEVSSMELPAPQVETQGPLSEQLPTPPTTEVAAAKAIEQGVSAPSPANNTDNNATIGGQQLPVPPIDDASVAQQPSGSIVGLPTIADDSDLIEKEWVTKAKQIVEQTRTDPHQQSDEISRVKADYLKKRYNKDVKLSET